MIVGGESAGLVRLGKRLAAVTALAQVVSGIVALSNVAAARLVAAVAFAVAG